MPGTNLVALIVGIFAVGSVNAVIRSFTAEKNVVKQGEQIVLTCFFQTAPNKEVQHLYKYFGQNASKIEFSLEDFADNTRFPRYSLTESTESDGFEKETLTITGAQTGDSGNYSCAIFNRTSSTYEYKFLLVAVEVEPTLVQLFLDDRPVSNGSGSEILKPLKGYRLRCEASGSNPAANISIMYGSVKLVQPNITTKGPIYRTDMRDPTYDYLMPVEYSTTSDISHWRFDAEAYDSPVTCVAKVNPNSPGVSATFTPHIDYAAPQFECNDTVYAPNGQRNFEITCTVFAKPEFQKARFFFSTATSNYSIDGFPLGVPHSTSDGKFTGIVKKLNEVKFNMTLTVASVDLKTNVKYSFSAENDRGQNIHSVVIKDPGLRPAAASSLVASTSLFASICLSALMIIFH